MVLVLCQLWLTVVRLSHVVVLRDHLVGAYVWVRRVVTTTAEHVAALARRNLPVLLIL